jgi:hypothetical protein
VEILGTGQELGQKFSQNGRNEELVEILFFLIHNMIIFKLKKERYISCGQE